MKFTSLKNKVKGAVSYSNRRCFSANGFSLLPLALEQRLFCLVGITLGMVINLTLFGNATFALDPCLDSTTPCLNVSIANSISLDLKPISPTGTVAKSDTAINTVGVMTNYFAGYTLGIAASSTGADAANLIQTAGEGNEQTVVGRISSIGTVTGVTGAGITEQEFSNANNTQYNNTWGYKVTNLNTTTSTNYLPAPTNTTSISMDTTNAANANTANNYNIAIGARVDTEVPKGSYTNTFVVQVVANPIPYTITYNKNTEEAVDYTVGDDIPNIVKEVKELYCKLEASNLSIESITLFMQRNGKDVKFSMDGDLSFPNLLELFNAAFGNNLVEASPLNDFTVNSEAL